MCVTPMFKYACLLLRFVLVELALYGKLSACIHHLNPVLICMLYLVSTSSSQLFLKIFPSLIRPLGVFQSQAIAMLAIAELV